MKVQRCPLESTDKRKIVKVDIISQQPLSDEDENYFGHILPIKTGHLIATWCIVVGRFRRNQISLSSRKYLTRNAYVLWTHSFPILYFLVKVRYTKLREENIANFEKCHWSQHTGDLLCAIRLCYVRYLFGVMSCVQWLVSRVSHDSKLGCYWSGENWAVIGQIRDNLQPLDNVDNDH